MSFFLVSHADLVIVKHPVVRRHPVTGGKALPEPGFTRRIVGLKTEDSSNPCLTILRRARTSRFMRGMSMVVLLSGWVDRTSFL
jgi:hypothetical protein